MTSFYSTDADADRAFLGLLRFPAVDAGEGWLIFARPPAEVASNEERGGRQYYDRRGRRSD